MVANILGDHAPFQTSALEWLCTGDTWVPPGGVSNAERLWAERYAMVVFYQFTNGDSWTTKDGWLSSSSVCEWYMDVADHCSGNDLVEHISLRECAW